MIRPTKPRKPKKPKPAVPTREVVDRFYLYEATIYRESESATTQEIVFAKDDETPFCDEEEDPYYEYYKIESMKLPRLLALLEEKGIDPENVVIGNEIYYRKSNGQIVLAISRSLSDEDYQTWVDGNQAQLDQYEADLARHPSLLEAYKEQKKLWDIQQTELKLQQLRGS